MEAKVIPNIVRLFFVVCRQKICLHVHIIHHTSFYSLEYLDFSLPFISIFSSQISFRTHGIDMQAKKYIFIHATDIYIGHIPLIEYYNRQFPRLRTVTKMRNQNKYTSTCAKSYILPLMVIELLAARIVLLIFPSSANRFLMAKDASSKTEDLLPFSFLESNFIRLFISPITFLEAPVSSARTSKDFPSLSLIFTTRGELPYIRIQT